MVPDVEWAETQRLAIENGVRYRSYVPHLSALFAEIWEDRLKHSPEYASYLGDKRYNDQLSDYSIAEVNASLSATQSDATRVAAAASAMATTSSSNGRRGSRTRRVKIPPTTGASMTAC